MSLDATSLDRLETYLDISAPYWRDNRDMVAIFSSYASLITGVEMMVDDYLINERLVESATEWGLHIMETQYGLRVEPAYSLDDRRAQILAAKRKDNFANESRLHSVAAALGLKVELIRNADGFVLEVDIIGEDKPIDEGLLYKTFREIIPAFLDLLYRVKIKVDLVFEHVLILNEVRAPLLNTVRMQTTPGGL
ncbi:putative phage tail protein [Exiguobacterium sp. s21]|uniref:putative phage tail protein n=1 Tax=Exiguobacterium sp. s21 TaxID=2751244 RepID=UPI001BE8BED0|nr:putative phage tail protein [Exiguobacterium sp. s21]